MTRRSPTAPTMNRVVLAIVFAALWCCGLFLASTSTTSASAMFFYALALSSASLVPVAWRAIYEPKKLMSGHTVVLVAPIWFLYLEAMFPGGDARMLPAHHVVHALAYAAFFLSVFNLAYVFRMPACAVRFHERFFRVQLPPNFFPIVGIAFTLLMLFVIWGYYGFSVSRAVEAYLGGRSTGSGGLIKRGGIGGWEVFLQPFALMAPVVPSIAALSWVRFGTEARCALPMRLLVTACAGLLIFMMFLGGSRGNMAVFLAGPAAIWILFGRRLPKTVFVPVTVGTFLFLIGMWEYQMRTRSNLLENVSGFQDIVEETTFNPMETHRDNNLYLFTLNVMYMPDPYPFEGYGDFYLMLVNPIPRAIWSGKPKGIQESAYTFKTVRGPASRGPRKLGTASLSSSIVSDGFRMHHYFGITLYAVIFGIMASVWDYVGQRRMFLSKLYFILNAAWLFWMLWSFRSSFAWITGMYSVWGAYVLCLATSAAASFVGVGKPALSATAWPRKSGRLSNGAPRHKSPITNS
jgi:hypothetical protein